MEFLDDHRFLANPQLITDPLSSPSLVVIDTGKDVGGIPMQTFLHLPPCPDGFGSLALISEQGVHNPPPPDSLAPFHHDPTQRIITLMYGSNHLIFQARTLLKLAERRGGSEIGWDEWKNHVVVLSFGFELIRAWVSGCRLFCVSEGEDIQDAKIMVYDFGAQRLSKYLKEYVDGGLDTHRSSSERDDWDRTRCPSPNGAGVGIPWYDMSCRYIGHDCFAFIRVSGTVLDSLREWG